MSKNCEIIKRKILTGNNVSHANNKTRRRFLLNIQKISLTSIALNKTIKLKLTTRTIRTIEKHNGLDSFLIKTPNKKLSYKIKKLKNAIQNNITK